ncbi:flagellar basal body-associated FliL family protein [Nocardioides ferulae]|uniref:flagellar basal body-associated FliL family protein n=1 Tax=Nocardioides ferulae TaxID=2340821 RepID=UPI000EAC680A|nr:flagellar basal body-associated FliL family protein [Nocardioides ferulae]
MSTKTAPDADKKGTDDAEPKSKRKKLVLVLVGVLVVAAAGYWFFLRPAPAEAEPVPGEVITLEPIQINLAEGHYLKVGIALQLTADADELDGSKALDATIALFSGLPLDEVSLPKQRAELKDELGSHLEEAYHGDVMEVYYTEFVTQ